MVSGPIRRTGPAWFARTHLASTSLCVGVLLLSVFLIRPLLESGLTDDWSTVRTAQLLAQTGHIHYNGWEAAMLGWPLYVAAISIHLFGPSFTSIRASDLLEAAFAVALLHRTLLRAGVTVGNAVFGTISLLLTPIFLLASVVFMTDIPGLIAVVVCLYSCIRALQSSSVHAAAAWVSFAAIANAVLGTARQIAWLGVLLLVPCTLWMLRRRREVLIAGTVAIAVSLLFVVACFWWFQHQPYVLVAALVPGRPGPRTLAAGSRAFLRSLLDTVLFLLPVLALFILQLGRQCLTRRHRFAIYSVLLAVFVLAFLFFGIDGVWQPPFLLFAPAKPQTAENTFTMTQMPVKGRVPLPMGLGFQQTLAALVVVALVVVLGYSVFRRRQHRDTPAVEPLSWRSLLVLTVPYAVAYCAFLFSRGAYNYLYDRYLLLTLPFLLLLLLRLYQDFAPKGVGWPAGLLLLPVMAYSVTTLHDTFAVYRAALGMAEEIRAAGYPRTAVDAGWEYNHFTQVLVDQYVRQPGIRLPNGQAQPNIDKGPAGECSLEVSGWTPVVKPVFAVAYPGTSCVTAQQFAPVHFSTWLPPFHRTALAVHAVPVE